MSNLSEDDLSDKQKEEQSEFEDHFDVDEDGHLVPSHRDPRYVPDESVDNPPGDLQDSEDDSNDELSFE
ncbi:hypothetical protein BSZ35_00200 [Salinibacter sp. 10B]|uniref:hypothetical protein n=1 Tax=Salinibacter sp. 10B TaxID=1923971 RepID=UPI000CF49CEF|nr:hypothetical protein [Salinibacter sp. 10B]PQJ36810.1 hypothetical protein BSZ35_00200 [Salinibacter sp. 10B]